MSAGKKIQESVHTTESGRAGVVFGATAGFACAVLGAGPLAPLAALGFYLWGRHAAKKRAEEELGAARDGIADLSDYALHQIESGERDHVRISVSKTRPSGLFISTDTLRRDFWVSRDDEDE